MSMQPVCKFSIYVSETLLACYEDQYTPDIDYPVLAMTQDDDEGVDLVLIANDQSVFRWIALEQCRLASVDD